MSNTHVHRVYDHPDMPGDAVCHDCGEVNPEGDMVEYVAGEPAAPGTAVDRVAPGELAALLQGSAMPFLSWASALLTNTEFGEDTGADSSYGIIAAILAAESSGEAMKVADMTPVEELCPKTPGAHSPLLRITGATPLKSTFDEGPPCFCVVHAEIVATGEQITTSIGARAVQAVILKHIHAGWMPFEAVLTRRLKPTRAGFYPMNLEAGG